MGGLNRRLFLGGVGATVGTALLARPAYSTPTVYYVNGVAVHRYPPASPAGRPPIVMVHGGAHAGWAFDRYATYLSSMNWDCHVLDWYHHGLSSQLPLQTFITRSITQVSTEIQLVVNALAAAPVMATSYILMGHSMGGLATLYSSQILNPEALVMVTPVVPTQVGAQAIQLEVNMTQPFPVPPFEQAKAMFYATMTDAEALVYYQQLQAESPQAVWEATRWTVSVNLNTVGMPAMAVGAEVDFLTPASYISTLAGMMTNCRYIHWPGIGHGDVLLKQTGYLPVVQDIQQWLLSTVG